jgi:hypothetical protein
LDKLPIFKQSRNKKETKTERIENKRKEIQIPKKKSKNKEEKRNQKRLFTPSLTSFSLLTPQSLPIYSIFFPPTNHPVLWLQNTLLILKVNTGAKNPSPKERGMYLNVSSVFQMVFLSPYRHHLQQLFLSIKTEKEGRLL